MAELLKQIVEYGFKIKEALDKADHNKEVCRRIDDLLNRLRAIAKHLQGSPKIMEDDLMRDTEEGLQKALQSASNLVAKCKRKGFLSRVVNADDIAQKLREVCLDVLLNMTAVLLANSALNNSVLAELKENVAQLHADDKYTKSMLAEILKILDARPDVNLPEEVEKMVEDYKISFQIKNKRETDVPSSSSQSKDKREAKITDVPSSSQSKDKREAKKTDVPSSQNKDKREANITDVPSSQSKDKREAKKTDVPSSQSKDKREAKITDVPSSSQSKDKREAKITDVPSSQNKDKREANITDVPSSQSKNKRPEDRIQKNNKRRGSKVVPHASLPDGLAEPASAASVVGQYDDGSSTIINKASSSISKSVDEAQSVGVSAAPIHPEKIISISEKLGETGRYKVEPHSSNTSKLEVSPQQLIFLHTKNEETTGCPVTLTNKTDDYVGIWIKPINEQFTKPEIMEPHSTLVVHAQPPKDTDKFEVLMIIVQSKGDHGKLESYIGGKLNMDSGFMVHVKNLNAEVYRAILTAITCEPASFQIIPRSIENVTSIDAHPTKTWIVTGHEGGIFSIWDYQKQETVMELQVKFKKTSRRHSVYSAKFAAEGKWLVVGDSHGYIHIYDCTDTKLHEVKKFRAHDKKSVNSLASHPTEPYLLSSSDSGRNIKVWDLSENCKEIEKFKVKSWSAYLDGVCSVKFNPRDTDTFACVTHDNRVKVWNKKTSIFETTLEGPCDFFFTHQHLVTLSSKNSHDSEIWDLKTGKVVHTLSVSGRKMTRGACHPKLPILVTALDDGTVCLWDASTYRPEKMVHITNSECLDLVFLPHTNGLPRLLVAFETMIAIMEVNLPIANTSNASGLITGTNQ